VTRVRLHPDVLAEVHCYRCGDVWTEHEAGGGACTVDDSDGACRCPGFQWVDPDPAPPTPLRAPAG